MGRILPFYRTGGALSGGGGGGGNTGVPLGPFNDWSELPASAQGGALAFVADLGPLNSYGIARYEAAGPVEWQLLLGTFLTLADLQSFAQPIGFNALASVGPSLDDPDSVRYQWDDSLLVPAWVRTPDPVEYIYAAIDWATLPAQDTIQADDEAVVASLGLGNAYGRAVYDGTDWLLSRAWFDTVADMTAFPELKSVGALASVEASASDDENGVRYQWNGSAWARTAALTAGYAWTLTQAQLVSGADPSGIGAVQEGDYGVFTPAGVPIVVRYKAATTVVAGAGGVAQAQWLPPEVYAGTPTIQAYLVGTEDVSNDVALNAQGWPTVTRTNGTLTSQTTRVRLATTTASGNVSFATLTSGVTTTTKVYARALTRMQVGSGTGTATAFCSPGSTNNGTTGITPAYISHNAAKGTFFWTGSADGSTGVDKPSQAAVAGLSGTDDLIEIIVNTAGGVRTCEMRRNGILVSTTDQVASGVADRCIYQVGSFNTALTSLATMDLSRVMVATW